MMLNNQETKLMDVMWYIGGLLMDKDLIGPRSYPAPPGNAQA